MKIFFYDLETAPTMAYVWKMWKENIAPSQVIEDGRILTWAGKWYGDDEAIYADDRRGYEPMVAQLHACIEEADAVVTYNGNHFDKPVLQTAILKCGYPPPAPAKMIDLYQTVKREFRFTHNRLGAVCEALGLDTKIDTGGFSLWARVMEGDDDAYAEMIEYNVQDVFILEQLYDRLLPWIKTHPNSGLWKQGLVCPNCGSDDLQRRGVARTQTQTYQRYQCQSCGAWGRSRKAETLIKPEIVRDST